MGLWGSGPQEGRLFTEYASGEVTMTVLHGIGTELPVGLSCLKLLMGPTCMGASSATTMQWDPKPSRMLTLASLVHLAR